MSLGELLYFHKSKNRRLIRLAYFATFAIWVDGANVGPPTFRATAQMVLVPVTVIDRHGKTIDGLGPLDFTVLDNQVPQQIASFSAEDQPCSVALVVDTSGSMRNSLDIAKEAALAFLRTANPNDEFVGLTVSTQPNIVSSFTADSGALEETIRSSKPDGMTALLDTIYLALGRMHEAARPRRALLIISDGMDNHSRYSKNAAMRVALEANVQVYTILLDGLSDSDASPVGLMRPSMIQKPGDRAAQRVGPNVLQELSETTGGLHFRVRNRRDAVEAATKDGRAMRNEYVIGYQPRDLSAAGKWHRVLVKSNVPKTNVYGRNGYYAR